MHAALIEECLEEREALERLEDLSVGRHFKTGCVIFTFALDVKSDLDDDFNLKFGPLLYDTCFQQAQLVISNDCVSAVCITTWQKVFKAFWRNVSFLELLLFFRVLVSCSRQVELEAHLILNTKIILDSLSKLFHFGGRQQLNHATDLVYLYSACVDD